MTRNFEDLMNSNLAANANIIVPKHQNKDLVSEAAIRLTSDNKECTSSKKHTSILSFLMSLISAIAGFIFEYNHFLDSSFKPVPQYDKAGYVIRQKRRFNVVKKICLFPIFIIGYIITINAHRIH